MQNKHDRKGSSFLTVVMCLMTHEKTSLYFFFVHWASIASYSCGEITDRKSKHAGNPHVHVSVCLQPLCAWFQAMSNMGHRSADKLYIKLVFWHEPKSVMHKSQGQQVRACGQRN